MVTQMWHLEFLYQHLSLGFPPPYGRSVEYSLISCVVNKINYDCEELRLSTINKTQEEINSGVFQARISVYQSMDYTLNDVKESTVLSSCLFNGCCTFCAH